MMYPGAEDKVRLNENNKNECKQERREREREMNSYFIGYSST
jgi:hypothetical protein